MSTDKTSFFNWFGNGLQLKATKEARKEFWQTAFISLAVLIFTFPGFYPEISLGLDGSYVYAFNYFFAHRIQLGAQHIFTYGPLVFIFAPNIIGNNLPLAIILASLIRFFFIYTFLLLGNRVNSTYRILHILLIIGLCNLVYLDLVFMAGTIVALLIYHDRKNNLWLIAISLYAAVAFLVKSSFGTLCFAAIYSYALYDLFKSKRPYLLIYFTAAITFFLLLLWFLIYHSFSAIPGYVYTSYLMVREYSNSLQVEGAVNHWGMFCLGLIFFFLPRFFAKNKLTHVLFLLSILPLYIAFKYTFAREDEWHEAIILNYILIICAIVLLVESNISRIALVMQIASVAFIYANMIMSTNYTLGFSKPVTGIDNFISWVLKYKSSLNHNLALDSTTLPNKALNNEQLKLIGNNTVDCYPFEYTFIPANKLNWAPRPHLQIYVSTPWIDSVNAAFIASADAPRFYIWQQEQPPTNNIYCDDRYLMSEDPHSTYQFFNHYHLVNFTSRASIFVHTANNLLGKESITATANGELDKWIDVAPCDSNSVTRARLHFTNTFKGTLRKMVYRDQLYFIDYMLTSGNVKTYRFLPINAGTGLWINPLVIDINKGLKGETVKAIRIRVSQQGCIDKTFRLEWATFHILPQVAG